MKEEVHTVMRKYLGQDFAGPLKRRKTKQIQIGCVPVGGGAPVVVQSMTKTDTRDVRATVAQIQKLQEAGCEIVRLAVPDEEAAAALKKIKKDVSVPLVADIHFDYRLALASLEAGVDGLRLNPGTIGRQENVKKAVKAAMERQVPIRIGVNSGSLEKRLLRTYGGATPEAMVESAMGHIRVLEGLGFDLIKVSLKASDVPRTVEAYRLLADMVDYPFHAGITEAGGLFTGAVKSSVGLGILLNEGLADTIRVSLTAPPEEEVRVAFLILKSLGVRTGGINLVSCPTCGRSEVNIYEISSEIERRLSCVKEPFTVAVMGCMVNGPGEAKEADIGLACGRGAGVIFKKGRLLRRVKEERIIPEFIGEVERFVSEIKERESKR